MLLLLLLNNLLCNLSFADKIEEVGHNGDNTRSSGENFDENSELL